jgi:hypothetical protein
MLVIVQHVYARGILLAFCGYGDREIDKICLRCCLLLT